MLRERKDLEGPKPHRAGMTTCWNVQFSKTGKEAYKNSQQNSRTQKAKTLSRTITTRLSNAVSWRCVKKQLLSQKNIRQNDVVGRIWKVWFRVVQQSCVEWWINISVACWPPERCVRRSGDLRPFHNGTQCGSGDLSTETGEQFCLGLCYWVPDLGDWQRLGGACPGRRFSPSRKSALYRSRLRMSCWPVNFRKILTGLYIIALSGLILGWRIVKAIPDSVHRPGTSKVAADRHLCHPRFHIRDHQWPRENLELRQRLWWWIDPDSRRRNVIDEFEPGMSLLWRGWSLRLELTGKTVTPTSGTRSTSGRNPDWILHLKPDLPACHPELDRGQ